MVEKTFGRRTFDRLTHTYIYIFHRPTWRPMDNPKFLLFESEPDRIPLRLVEVVVDECDISIGAMAVGREYLTQILSVSVSELARIQMFNFDSL